MGDKDNVHFQQAVGGMNMDSASGQKPRGTLSFAMNAQIQGFDGESVMYQSEQSNEYYASLPPLYKVVGGPFNISQINRVIFFLANESTGDSQIGWIDNEDGIYKVGIEGSCLGFDVKFPIHQLVVKTINCSTQIYWTDNNQLRRFLDFDNLPWKETKNPNNDFEPIQLVGQLDCNKLLIQPHFSVPSIFGVKEIIGGQLKMGAYQATIQYADILGNGLTDYYNVSNPFGIFTPNNGGNFDLPTDKAIVFKLENLDTSGLYDFYNIAIVKTINDITSVELAAKGVPITGKTSEYTYTGAEHDAERLNIVDVFQKKAQYFDKAAGVTSVDDVIVWYDLTSSKDINYQKVANAIRVQWETYKIPYNEFEAYKNGLNTAEYRSYLRDEVYTLSWVPILRTGEQKQQFPIPGRRATAYDRENVDNADSMNVLEDPCATPVKKERWEVYNTGSKIGFSPEYLAYTGEDSCYKGPYEYGEMSYWQSERNFPNNPTIWGELAGTPILHHKLPDNGITSIHDNNTNGDRSFEHAIFPIGFKISGVKEAIETSDLTQEEKDNIVGFKIVRGNRAGNQSIIAKGMFNNVGKYTYEPYGVDEPDDNQTYYYPNYPFNDLRPDPFFTQKKIKDHTGYRPDKALKGFDGVDSKSRFVFYSPDTQFKEPFGINSGYLKLETIEYGESYGHFTPVDDNAKYLFLNKNGYKIAYGAGIASTINGTVSYTTPWDYQVGGTFSPENFPTSFQGMLDLLNKILPKSNFGYSFNSIGYYNKSYPVPNDGDKLRAISYGKYLHPEYNNIEDGNTINNYQREQSVYLHTAGDFKFPHEYSNLIPEDTSRYNISSYKNKDTWAKFLALYLANKNVVTDDDIRQSLIEASFSGPSVFGFLVVTPPVGTPITVGSIYDYYDASGNLKGSFKVQEVLSGTAPYSVIATLESGRLEDITNSLTPDASDRSGINFVEFLYINNSTTITNNNNLVLRGTTTPTLFESANVSTYQAYTSGNANNNINNLVANVKSIYGGITSEEALTDLDVPYPYGVSDFEKLIGYGAFGIAEARYANAHEAQFSLSKDRQANICSYYGSIKRIAPDQWGDIYSYSTIDTGFYSELRNEDGSIKTSFKTIFGGDTFITRHAFKIKLPFFEDNTVQDGDGTDIEYDKIATLTHPMFWISTRSVDVRSDLVSYIESKARQIVDNGGTLEAIEIALAGVYALQMSFHILKEVLYTLGIKNLNLDNFKSTDLYEQGIMYLFAYGIPYYFCESNINTDYRHATNDAEGNFYPNVGEEIPDEWVQEANVSILEPEQFSYNNTYSKQNKENYYTHLRLDYDPEKACYYYHNNLAVWSDQSSLEETKNNWLTYRPGNRFNFPKEFGKLTALDRLQNKVVLARFENRSRLYNSMVKIDTSTPYAAAIGNDSLFSGAPAIDLSDSTGGSFGSQHKFILNTEQGDIFIDSVRGQIALLRGQQVVDIAQAGMDKWFKHFLPFFIKKIDNGQNLDTDNSWNGIGYCGVYDSLYKRVIITKKDYEPLVQGISYNENGQYIFNGSAIELTDSAYFCDRSWTLSYSFITNSWTSFHSYQPNFYIEYAKHFQSGVNSSVTDVYSHNTSFTSYHKYYNVTYPYILEYCLYANGYEDEVLNNVSDYTKSLKYTNYETYTSPTTTHYFNKAIIYNDQQCTGILNLVPKKGLGSYGKYPIYNGDSKDIQVTKTDSCFNFNTFWNITKNADEPIWKTTCEFKYTNKTLNFSNLDYNNKSYNKAPVRSKETYIRLISDIDSDIRLISRFIISPTSTSKL